MKQSAIEESKTYRGKTGSDRFVVSCVFDEELDARVVVYRKADRSIDCCTQRNFAAWAERVVR